MIKDDIKGLRMRIFGLGGRVMAQLGATTVLVPGGTLLRAFDKKEIDAAELYHAGGGSQQGLQAKVKLIYVPGWHQPETVLELLINKDRWSGLSDRAAGANRDRVPGDASCDVDRERASSRRRTCRACRQRRRPHRALAADVLGAFRAAWTEVAKDEGEQDSFFKAVLDDIEKFRAKPQDTGGPQATPAPQASSSPQSAPGPEAPTPQATP